LFSLKIIKIVATRSHFLKLKCTKFDFGWAPPQTQLKELTVLSRTPSWILGGPASKGEEWKKRGQEKEGREMKGKGKGRGGTN